MQLATLCYLKCNDKTLMLHRTKKKNDIHEGKWNGLGGKLLAGETPEECVMREFHEESGLTLQKPRLMGLLTFPRFSKGVDWYVYVFLATKFTGKEIDSPEGHLHWIKNEDVPKLNLWEGDLIFWEWLRSDRFFSGKFEYQNGVLTNHTVVFY